jgi:hypothetical protein
MRNVDVFIYNHIIYRLLVFVYKVEPKTGIEKIFFTGPKKNI